MTDSVLRHCADDKRMSSNSTVNNNNNNIYLTAIGFSPGGSRF